MAKLLVRITAVTTVIIFTIYVAQGQRVRRSSAYTSCNAINSQTGSGPWEKRYKPYLFSSPTVSGQSNMWNTNSPTTSGRGGCTLNINDPSEATPLILKPRHQHDGNRFFLPTSGGTIYFDPNEEILLACTGQNNALYINGKKFSQEMTIICDQGKEFNIRETHIGRTAINIASIKCNKTPQSEVKSVGQCHINHNQYNIGFQLMNGDFIRLIEVCFDRYRYTTLYTKFTVVSGVDEKHQTGKRHNNFRKDYFNGITPPIEYAYKERSPRNRGELALDKGHLAAWADFTYFSQRLATQYYINVVPQWDTFNRGNWNMLEGRIRDYAREASTDLVVYAGSCSPSNEVDTYGRYLAGSEMTGRQVVPVPEHLFRIVYNQDTKRSVVFLGKNSVDRHTSSSQHTACAEDYDELVSFTKRKPFFKDFLRLDSARGYIYCCRLRDFLQSCDLNNTPLSEFLLRQ